AQDVIRGVNLGGWLVTEPWMTPSLFRATSTQDEWHLCSALGKDKCYALLQDHWSTFYTRDDFVQIKKAGLNSVRIPLGYWAVDLLSYEPYVSGQYPYLINAVRWAKDIGLTVMIDLHGAPGSQNGWEESGITGPVEFPANQTNTDRTIKVLKNLTDEFSQSTYGGAVISIELLNEPKMDFTVLSNFYSAAFETVVAGNASGINVTIHDGFFQPHSWANYHPTSAAATESAEYLSIDTHQFWAFPPLDNLTKPEILDAICDFGQQQLHMTSGKYTGILPTVVGEWSLSTGITGNSTTQSQNDPEKRTWFRTLFEAQNAAYTPKGPGQPSIGWYYWAWKTEYDIDAWSYRRGIAEEYIPSDVSDSSKFVFPIKPNGCIDETFHYSAPKSVPTYTASDAVPSSTSTATG
ncbi:glycoside hydrolase family 5 protein, partial [Piedraia hortae CBS 480.64]